MKKILFSGELPPNSINGVANSNEINIKILTDFGNIIERDIFDVHHYYDISLNYLEAIDIGYPLLSIKERIQQQIELLQKALLVV